MEAFVTYAAEHDFVDSATGTPEHMPVDTFIAFVDFLRKSQLHEVIIRGNEAGCHPQLEQLLSAAGDRNIAAIVETTGVMNENRRRFLQKAPCAIGAKIYHPDLYPEAHTFKDVLDFFERLSQEKETRLSVRVYVDDPRRDYSFIENLCQVLSPAALEFQMGPLSNPLTAQRFTAWLISRSPDIMRQGVQLSCGCFFPPCSFKDKVLGRMVRLNLNRAGCHPKPGIRPDGKVYHCKRMMDYPTVSFSNFDSFPALTEFQYRAFHDCQLSHEALGICLRCESFFTGACVGRCMYAKRRAMQETIDRLETIDTDDLSAEELLRAGHIYSTVHSWDQAEKYLRAARGADPANGEIHLLFARVLRVKSKIDEAEEEYTKAARLLSDTGDIKAEAQQMKNENSTPTASEQRHTDDSNSAD